MENIYIKNAFGTSILPCQDPYSEDEWARFGLFIGVRFLKEIRSRRYLIPALVQNEKEDGSPATLFEEILEMYAIEKLNEFYPKAGYIGEESGDLTNQEEEIVMLLDPIDGTRSFLAGFDTYSVTLSILLNNKPLFSLICSPSTGDIGYRIGKNRSKLFQVLGDPNTIKIFELPLLKETGKDLINIHPSVNSGKFIERLYKKWKKREISLVRSISGSPSLMFLETAKGCGVYINGWGYGETYPFDIIPGLHILEGAGGYILNESKNNVDPWNHSGPFIAGLNRSELEEILNFLI